MNCSDFYEMKSEAHCHWRKKDLHATQSIIVAKWWCPYVCVRLCTHVHHLPLSDGSRSIQKGDLHQRSQSSKDKYPSYLDIFCSWRTCILLLLSLWSFRCYICRHRRAEAKVTFGASVAALGGRSWRTVPAVCRVWQGGDLGILTCISAIGI